MPPDVSDRLAHIRECCEKILRYTQDIDRASFEGQELIVDAVVRNIEIIGEASKHVPDSIRTQMAHIEWKDMIGMRSWIAHGYHLVETDAVWNVVANKIPEPLRTLQTFKDENPR